MTIPIAIRQTLGIGPETEVEFELIDGEARMRVVRGRKTRGSDVVPRLRGTATTDLTTDEILGATRDG